MYLNSRQVRDYRLRVIRVRVTFRVRIRIRARVRVWVRRSGIAG